MTRPAGSPRGRRSLRLPTAAALALGAVAYFQATAGFGQAFIGTPSRLSSTSFRSSQAGQTVLRAEKKKKIKEEKVPGWDEGSDDMSFLGTWEDEDRQEQEEELENEPLAAEDMQGDIQIDDEQAVEDGFGDETAEQAARQGRAQEKFEIGPAKNYVSYVAKKNAIRVWRRHERDTTSLEVKIALATERIRDLVVHLREHRHDHYARQRLVMIIANRRKMLDKLSWKDVDMYIKIRDTLKIRHVYRIERLIGRLPEYVYTIRDRQKTPGLRTLRRMRKMEEKRFRRQKRKPYPLKAFMPKWKTSDREMREMTEYNLNRNTFQEG